MKVVAADGVAVYNLSAGKALPQWLSERKRRALNKDEDFLRRVQLVQDLEFPSACHKLKYSPDGRFILAAGTHNPQVRCFELAELSMKWVRHLDAEVVDFQVLSEDYAKLALLCNDRSIQLHARPGAHYAVRVPKYGRELAYCRETCDLLVAGSCPEIYRLNLEQGRFLSPLPSKSTGVNACGISPAHGLFGCAGEDGVLEFFDLRARCSVGATEAAAFGGRGDELTALRFHDNGLEFAVGTGSGHVALYDLRSSRPLRVKDHNYDSRIVSIKFHGGDGTSASGACRVVSADRHVVKVWDAATGANVTNIQPEGGAINHVCLEPAKGLILVGCDAPKVQTYFVPSLGPAPKWCSYLEGLTEELEQDRTPAMYDDFRFVTKPELRKLALDHLVGTPMLRAYMHGYFVNDKLYKKAKALADPFAYEKYRAERVKQKLEEERKARISVKKRLPKVNAGLASRLMEQGEQVDAPAAAGRGARKRDRGADRRAAASLLEDERFSSLFSDARFAIDENDATYRLLHPNAPASGGAVGPAAPGAAAAESEEEAAFNSESEEEAGAEDAAADLTALLKKRIREGGAQQAQSGPRLFHLKEGAEEAEEEEEGAGAAAAAAAAAERVEGEMEFSFVPRDGGGGGKKARRKRPR